MGPGLRPGAIQPRRLAALRRARNLFLIFALRKSTKMKKKSASRRMRNLWKDRPKGRSFFFCLFRLIPGADTGNQ